MKIGSFCPRDGRSLFSGPDQSGSVLIYIVVVMLIFGFLGAGLISMFTSSTMMSSGVPNYGRNAEHLAEAGMRYAISEMRNSGYTKGTISTLNSTTYTLENAGSFTFNVFGKWFEPVADYNAGSGTLSLSVPQGQFPSDTITTDDFDIPANAWVVNLEGYRDALIYTGTPLNYTAEIQGVSYSSIDISLTDHFQARKPLSKPADPICLAVRHAGVTQSPVAGGVLNLPVEAKYFFPEKFGAFHVTDTMDIKKHYFYETMTDQTTHVELAGLSETLNVYNNDFIILAPRNHMIAVSGAAGSATAGGKNFHAANFSQNIESPQDVVPPAIDLPTDLDTDTILGGMGTVGASDAGAVDVDTGTGEITLGGGLTSEFGAVFFGEDVSIGGATVCSGGKCLFQKGLRTFFVLDYNGVGDGFTFAVINGTDNAVGATGGSGGSGELLGYAGDGGTVGTGLQPPKLALEFDTYVNSGRDDPDLGTPPPSNRDVLQYVFWGDDAGDLDDDNIHDTGGSAQKPWSPKTTTPALAVTTKPVVNSSNNYVYVNSNGYIHGIHPDTGAYLFSPFYLGTPSQSSPALDTSGNIIVGDDFSSGYINSLKSDGSGYNWAIAVNGDVRSSPVLDSSDVIYFGTENGLFYAFSSGGTKAWEYDLSSDGLGGANINCTPDLSPDEATVYFATEDTYSNRSTDYLYALNASDGSFKWRYDLLGDCYSSPTVDADGTIYIGGHGGSGIAHVFAIKPDGSLKWRFDFPWTNPESRPVLGADGTVYIGNNDNYLYAIPNDEDTTGIFDTYKWRFPTSGRIQTDPLVHADGTIWFGSNDHFLYVVDSDGLEINKFDLGGEVRSSPRQGPNGSVYAGSNDRNIYALKSACDTPRNIKTRTFSYSDLYDPLADNNAVQDLADITDPDDWLNSGPWAVRIEIERDETANARGLYEYKLSSWIRKCQQADCSDIAVTFFADTRIEYAARDPHLQQTIEFCSSDNSKFDTFLYGFTQATGSATQTAVIRNLSLGFIRPGDFVVNSDANW